MSAGRQKSKLLTVYTWQFNIAAMDTSLPTPTIALADFRAHSLTGMVQQEIERMILSGELAPGQRLNEKAVADKLMISRGPIREACRALAELGLVYLIPNRGVFVKRLSEADAREVYDVRAGLIGLSASLLAPMITSSAAATLDGFIDEMAKPAEQGDYARFEPLNLAFHDFIVRSTDNARLVKLYRGLVKEFRLFRVHGAVTPEALLQSNNEHREIVDALKARDPILSYQASFRHVGGGKSRMLKALEALGGAESANAPIGEETA
jgi:DNA-binding GntR family transcriptional regulator